MDIKEFYPFISEETLNKAINFAENFTSISHENIPVIKDCRKSILFDDNESWKKKEHRSLFDVTKLHSEATPCVIVALKPNVYLMLIVEKKM